ncbi:hypothetical protein [Sphingobium yanoikuyae]|uniref:hypothetical protein n=1 Tax=Sphingobium yanoikuyae TaxID=13690 RepID=UPI0028AF7D58|nr:hypothetical protein [Sphingobium yanoikuyae]
MAGTHPNFEEPSDKSIGLWRYMDLAKFMSLLEGSSLYFARADKLGDPFEGSVPTSNVTMYDQLIADDELRKRVYPDMDSDGIRHMREQIAASRRQMAQKMFVSCCHASNHESAAMWSIYSKIDESIAVRTSYSKLNEALPSQVYLGKVNYIDYQK